METVSPQPNRRQRKAPNTTTRLRTRRHPGTTDTRDVPRCRGDTDERRKKNHHCGVSICTTIYQEALRDALGHIRRLTRPRETGRDIIITGDFDRHDSLWGGDHVSASPRQGEADDIASLDLGYYLRQWKIAKMAC